MHVDTISFVKNFGETFPSQKIDKFQYLQISSKAIFDNLCLVRGMDEHLSVLCHGIVDENYCTS